MTTAAIAASFIWQVAYSLAAPTPNTTAIVTPIAEPAWGKEPKGRGTVSIILTSVLTLGLCVWTAIHPNLKPNASTWQRLEHRFLFVVIGLLAPEIVLAVAFYEWRVARKFHREWCDLYGVDPSSDQDTLRMKGAFFVTMGGVSIAPAYTIPNDFQNIISADAYIILAQTNTRGEKVETEKISNLAAIEAARRYETVESRGLDPGRFEVMEEQVRHIGRPEEEEEEEVIIKRDFIHHRDVQDKGKAEMLGKTLVCVQALWMLVQCVVRKASGLPVTLLEIHVAVHVICAIGMYAFWFNKPQDVGEPLPIGISNDPGQLCLEVVNQNQFYRDHCPLVWVGGDITGDDVPDPSPGHIHTPSPGTTQSVLFLGGVGGRELANPDITSPQLIIPHHHVLDLGHLRIYNEIRRSTALIMPSGDLLFLARADQAYEAGKRPRLPRQIGALSHVSASNAKEILAHIDISNCFPATLILFVYGACHAAAWNTHFPSHMECLLWRISSMNDFPFI